MARLAVADGVRHVVATPHQERWDALRCQQVQAQLQHFQRELALGGVQLAVSSGVELMLTHDLLETTGNERAHTLNGSRYLLVELPAYDYPLSTADVIFAVQLRGLVPILAHPERCAAFQDDINKMVVLARRGVLGQLTVGSLAEGADRDIRRCAERLLKRGLVQLLASDGHDTELRAPRLADGVRAAARVVHDERAQAMVTHVPEAILADRAFEPATLLPPQPERRWRGFRLLRRDQDAHHRSECP